jgi:hypothetical protein
MLLPAAEDLVAEVLRQWRHGNLTQADSEAFLHRRFRLREDAILGELGGLVSGHPTSIDDAGGRECFIHRWSGKQVQ